MENALLTSRQLEHRLDVTPMTVWNWRQLEDPIPTTVLPGVKGRGGGSPVRFPIGPVAEWLNRNRPTIVHKLFEDSCQCSHCVKMQKLTETVAAAIEKSA